NPSATNPSTSAATSEGGVQDDQDRGIGAAAHRDRDPDLLREHDRHATSPSVQRSANPTSMAAARLSAATSGGPPCSADARIGDVVAGSRASASKEGTGAAPERTAST